MDCPEPRHAPGIPRTSPPVSPRHESIELFVRRHPHAVLQIVGLVARRGFHLEGIVAEPTDDRRIARVRLLVGDDGRIAQLVKQLEKLHDVRAVRRPVGAALTP